MTRLRYILLGLLCPLMAAAGVVTYTPDDTTIFRNPERGFTEELGGETRLSNSNNHVVQAEADWYFDETDPDNADRASQSLVMLMYYLYNFRTQDLSNAILQGLDEDMQILRNHGFKCVLRFAYDWNSKNDASLSQVKRHIAQLKPHLEANKDVIYVLEAGFVGRWGEWYYSQNFGNETQELNANRRQVLAALLDACPTDRFLLVRYPLIKLSYLGHEVPLDSAEAFSATERARIGHHNDAFLNAWGNDGTYGRNGEGPDDDPVLRAYIAQETLYTPNGGETNVEDCSDTPGLPAQVYSLAEQEMSTYHWSFCGSTYSEEVTDLWRSSGIFDELNRKMGYRYQLLSTTLPDSQPAGTDMTVTIQLRNVGYAPLYNPRTAYLVLRDDSHSYALPLPADPRRWLPNGVTTLIHGTVSLPDTIPAGSYQLYLHMPDAAPSLAGDPRYAIRFANIGTWDAETGMNRLNATLSVTTPGGQNIRDARAGNRTVKVLLDGQVLILRGDKKYTIMGNQLE